MNFITIVQSSFRVILGLDPWIHLFLDRMHGCRITPVKSEHLFHRGVLFICDYPGRDEFYYNSPIIL